MAIHNATARAKPQQQSSFPGRFISPNKGIDTRVSLSSDNPEVCVYAFNLVPSEYGLRIRDGYREWQIGVDDGANLGVHTILPFEGGVDGTGDNKLFCVNNEGIWDVTVAEAAPILMIGFLDTQPDAGYGTYIHYIDDAGNIWMFYADSVNGLFRYNADTNIWEIPDDITGIDPINIIFVVEHKLRIWFVERSSGNGWYLPQNSISGAAERFNFGIHFKHGGSLVGLYSWTVDGGLGVDDHLVAISSSGDVLPYKGEDPATVDLEWRNVGVYFIGATAKGARCGSQYGGNLTFLSTFGLTEMSELLRGVDPRLPEIDSASSPVSALIRTDMRQYRNDDGWDIKYLQAEGVILVTTPKRLDGTQLQYAYNLIVGGWGLWRDVPITAVDSWQNFVYFGTEDGRICVMDVEKDNVLITPPEGINGQPIEFSMLHNYSSLGDTATFKRGKLIRPDFLSKAAVTYDAKFLYDFDITELAVLPPSDNSDVSVWDVGLWDSAIWSSGELVHYDKINGGMGIGRYVSVAIKGNGISGTTLASTDILWDKGWFL